MTLEEVKAALQGISTLATLIKLWQDSKKTDKTLTIQQIEQAPTLAPPIGDFTAQQMKQVVPDLILDSIRDTIRGAIERFADALKDPANTRQDKDQEEKRAKAIICAELHRIKRLNHNQVPSEFEDNWVSFGCAQPST